MAVSNEIYENFEIDYEENEATDGIEDIYSNVDIIHSQYSGNKTKDLTPKRIPLATYPGSESTKWKPTRTGVVCLGLLTFLLLAGIIGLLVCYIRVTHSLKEKIFFYETNSTAEQDQFQARYSAMTEERDQLQAERDQVQDRYSAMTEERDQLQAERDQSQARHSAMTEERDQLQAEREHLRANLSFISQQIQQGWVYFSSSWYFISTAKKTWEDSRRDCVGRTADLLVINSLEEQVFIHGLKKEGFWIGLTDKYQEGKWMWVDGTELTTGFWESGQPNSDGGIEEDCVAKWLKPSSQKKSWHDVSCNELLFWMCEKMLQL
ncbi:CD209 antigen-like protein B [Esox lucius]|uniref:CD209 antigen-like protein B n=1 Tax=Esox lucius TaxID=8010 RepID=UPI0014774A16|nr:CD209 antigen-like protein B [Esox lucius]